MWTPAFALGLLLWGRTASAELSIQGTSTRTASHQHSGYLYYISQSDCLSGDDLFTFTFSASPANGSRYFQVWVSETSDCKDHTARTGTSKVCTQLTEGVPANIQKSPFSVTLKSSDIARALPNVDDQCVDSGGSTSARKVSVNFLSLAAAEDDSPESDTNGGLDIQVDLVGPSPPASLTATSGEASILVSLPTNTSVPTDLAGYNIYCDPPPLSDGSGSAGCGCANVGAGSDAGTTTTTTSSTTSSVQGPPPPDDTGGTGGTGGGGAAVGSGGASPQPPPAGGTTGGTGGTTGGTGGITGGTGGSSAGAGGGGEGGSCVSDFSGDTCKSCVFDEGAASNMNTESRAAYKCGTIYGTGNTGTASILDNNTKYSVAVAAFDLLGNEGKLSPYQCATPMEVSDFFETYREAGGKGGGGCTVSPELRATSVLAPISAMIASLALALRRKSRKPRANRGSPSRRGETS